MSWLRRRCRGRSPLPVAQIDRSEGALRRPKLCAPGMGKLATPWTIASIRIGRAMSQGAIRKFKSLKFTLCM